MRNIILSIISTLLMCLVLAVTIAVTWENAHRTVAKECQTLGSFYVGDAVFTCEFKTINRDEI